MSPASDAATHRQGLIHAVLAYGLWGTFPLFWRLLNHVPPLEQFAHRVMWAGVFFALLASVRGELPAVRQAARDPRAMRMLVLGALLLGANWYVYILAVATNRVLEASLGYYLNPLLNVLLGAWFLGERLKPAQTLAVVLAGCGVAVLTWRVGTVPWIALALAGLFAGYGFVRKISGVGALVGSTVETAMMAAAGLVAITTFEVRGTGTLESADGWTWFLLVATGPVTALPILGFASAARKLPLSTLGFVQYLSPTIQLAIAVLAFGELFDAPRQVAFAFIWAGVALYAGSSVRGRR